MSLKTTMQQKTQKLKISEIKPIDMGEKTGEKKKGSLRNPIVIDGDVHLNYEPVYGCLNGWGDENSRWSIHLLSEDGCLKFESSKSASSEAVEETKNILQCNNGLESPRRYIQIINGVLVVSEPLISAEDLLFSIVDGEFTMDGRKLVINDSFSCSRTELQSLVDGPAIIRGSFFGSFNELQSLIGAPHIVEGSFYCSHNPELMSLEGSPREIGGDLYCTNNTKLASLAGAPQEVGGSFTCSNTGITSLEGSPQKVGFDFNYSRNPYLTSLEGAPEKVEHHFDCSENLKLTSLKGGPKNVGGSFTCSNTGITSLEGSPQTVGSDFNCCRNPALTALVKINFYIHEIDGHADFTGTPIKSNILGLLKIRNLKRIAFDDKQLEEIMNRHLPMGDSTDCIDDLLDAGYGKEYCKW